MTKLLASLSMLLIAVLGLCAMGQNLPANGGPETPVSTVPPAQASQLPTTTGNSVPAVKDSVDSNDPLLQPPPLPRGSPTLIGGTVSKLDKVRESVIVKPFGGKNMKIYFDERTHIYRNGVETTMLGIHRGDRVYIDTLSDAGHVFAKNIRIDSRGLLADARGQVVQYNAKDGQLEIRDELSSSPVTFRVSQATVIRRKSDPGSLTDLLPGSLVTVRFAPEAPGRGVAREVDIHAAPGSVFLFAGKVTFLNMSRGVLALQNRTDDRSYEIHFEPEAEAYHRLGVGDELTVNATFDGQQYQARSISVSEARN
jgi:hypothetical protein